MPLQSEREPDFDARWAAWLARGAAQDRALGRRSAFVLPAVLVVAVVVRLADSLILRRCSWSDALTT
jgi:hypothetical protein